MHKKLDAYKISMMGLLIAIMVILSRILGFEWQFIKISFDFVPKIIMAMLFGPLWTGVGAVVADLIGMMLFAKAAFFPGFTLNAFLGGAIYGYFFYKKEVTIKNAFLCTLVNTLLIGFVLTPLWLAIMYNQPLTSWVIWGPRLVKGILMLPIQTILTYVVGRAIPMKQLMKRSRYSF
ncbi:folate family ECF transporter S component [Enterococcus sp. LJL98]